jgi:hypothetical protein
MAFLPAGMAKASDQGSPAIEAGALGRMAAWVQPGSALDGSGDQGSGGGIGDRFDGIHRQLPGGRVTEEALAC